jgi:RimJ/RimL family protein N-acetyltransferase
MNAISNTQLQQIDQYWATFFGCALEALKHSEPALTISAGSPGLFAFMNSSSRVYALAPGLSLDLGRRLTALCLCDSDVTQAAQHLLADYNPLYLYGPAQVLYCSSETFRSGQEADSRPLTLDDQDAIERFCTQVGALEWKVHDVSRWPQVFGIFADKQLVSTAAVQVWGDVIGAISVVTLPAYRNRGYAQAITRAATRWMLEETSLIPQYDAELRNAASLRVARAVGYQPYGRLLVVQLRHSGNGRGQLERYSNAGSNVILVNDIANA